MIISYSTLLLIVNPQAKEVDTVIAIKTIPVSNNLIELDVVARITIVTNDFSIVVFVLFF